MTDVAIVMPVLDEADNIGALLDDCQAQRLAPAEVIVVDAGSTDGTYELASRRSAQWPRLTVLRLPGATPGEGRNAGISEAHAPLIATLDAGSRVAEDWLATLSAPLADAADDRVCVGASHAEPQSEFERAAGWFTLRAFKSSERGGILEGAYLPAGRNGYCFSKRLWERAGGYPAGLRWSEDKLFFKRMLGAGAQPVVVHGAVVRWRPRRTLRELYRQYEGYGRGDALARVHRRHELVPLAMYAAATGLAALAVTGSTLALWLLAAGAAAYLGGFTIAAGRALPPRALVWIPLIRVVADVAKIRGFIGALLGRRATSSPDS